jgi:hypothetical protein
MALRLALVIDGDASGAKKALQETAGGIDEVGKKAEGVARPLGDIGGGLAEAGDAAGGAAAKFEWLSREATEARIGIRDTGAEGKAAAGAFTAIGVESPKAASGIADIGGAADAAGGKLSTLRSAALGIGVGLVAGLGAAVLATGLEAAAGAALDFVRSIIDNQAQVEADLKSHEELVRRIKGAYNEAQGAASSYGKESRALLTFEQQQNIDRLERDFRAGLGDIQGTGLSTVENLARQGAQQGVQVPFAGAVKEFREDLQDGIADVIEFRRKVAEEAAALAEDSPFRELAEQILEQTETQANLQAELERSIDLYKGLTGDAEAAAAALGGSAEKLRLNGEAAAGALPALERYGAIIKSIGGGAAAAPDLSAQPGRPPGVPGGSFAAGGVVDRPTLFSYGAGEIGLMGEAGPEAILPLDGGRVRARGTGGRIEALDLVRLPDGDLGVELPAARPFAAGGVFGRAAAAAGKVAVFASGGVVPGLDLAGGTATAAVPNLFTELARDVAFLRGSLSGFGRELLETRDVLGALGGVIDRVSQRFLDFSLNALDRAVFGGWSGGQQGGGLFGGWLQSLAQSMLGTGYFPPAPVLGGAGLYHGGGTAGAPSAVRPVPLAAFATAPRFHTGNLFGPGELPAIVMEGEEIGWPDQLARKYGGPRQSVVNNFYVETPNPKSFAESRATVARAGARFMGRLGRYS